MSSDNGLMGAAAFRKPGVPYYAESQNPVIRQPTLVSPVALQNPAATSTGFLTVGSAAEGVYEGAISIQPGPNSLNPTGNQVGITVRASTLGVNVEIGDNAQSDNFLYIAGPSGVAQVYDEKYNQPVSLQAITKTTTNPNLTPANPEEILRSGQAGVAAAIAAPGTIFNVFTVPRTGAYMVQTQISIGNAGATNTVVIPSTLVGGVPIWKSIAIGLQEFGTVIPVPYAGFEVIGGDFYADQALAASSLVTKTYTSVAILDSTTSYAIVLNAEAGWNIGDGGQIKTELIAMC